MSDNLITFLLDYYKTHPQKLIEAKVLVQKKYFERIFNDVEFDAPSFVVEGLQKIVEKNKLNFIDDVITTDEETKKELQMLLAEIIQKAGDSFFEKAQIKKSLKELFELPNDVAIQKELKAAIIYSYLLQVIATALLTMQQSNQLMLLGPMIYKLCQPTDEQKKQSRKCSDFFSRTVEMKFPDDRKPANSAFFNLAAARISASTFNFRPGKK